MLKIKTRLLKNKNLDSLFNSELFVWKGEMVRDKEKKTRGGGREEEEKKG